MKFVPIRELRNQAAKVWDALRKEHELVLTSNGQPIALLTEIDGDNMEKELKAVRRARAALALESIRRQAAQSGADRMTMPEIEKEIRAARKSRVAGRAKT